MSYLEYVTSDHRADEDPLRELARLNHFALPDLEENRKGLISNNQFRRLLWRALGPLRYTLGGLIAWLILCLGVKTLVPGVVLTVAGIVGGKGLTVLFFAVTLSCAGAAAISLMQCGRRTVLLLSDITAGTASSVDGRVFTSREESRALARARGGNRARAWYVVGDEYFEVDQKACAALRPGVRYRLYHTPNSKVLLSIEPAPAQPSEAAAS